MARSLEWITEAQAELDKADMSYRDVICSKCRLPESAHPKPPCQGYEPQPRWAAIMARVNERIAGRRAS